MLLTIYLEKYGNKEFHLIPCSSEQTTNKKQYTLQSNSWITGYVQTEQIQDSILISLHLECIPDPYNYLRVFQEEKAFALEFCISDFVQADLSGGLAIRKFDPFWTTPVFFTSDTDKHFDHLQQLLTDNGNSCYIHYLPLAGGYGITDMELSPMSQTLQLCFHPYQDGNTVIHAPLTIISTSSTPYQAVEKSYQLAWKKKLILTPPRSLKQYPSQLNGLGWCTWNAFYHNVTADGIKAKLEEFKKKNIPIKWIIIDDGWSQTKDLKLISQLEDLSKFPMGLKALIQDIKTNYSVEYVGVWHAFTGYWLGISPDSYQDDSDSSKQFALTPSKLIIPGNTEDDAYDFFYGWHHYLKEQGVDFLKVDAQGNALEFLHHSPQCCERVQHLHNALERSVAENFDNCLINCMGLGSLDMYSRRYSPLIRNSGDFFPDKEDGFTSHILQNAYNSIFNSPLYYCDFDMWWTKHFSAKQSSILRAISGGPIYISDRVGETDAGHLLPLIDEAGNIKRPTDTAKPTADCIFTDPTNGVLKLYNRFQDYYILAIFNLSCAKKEVSFRLKDMFIDITDDMLPYHAHFHFAQKMEIIDKNTISFFLEANDAEIINISCL